jgi:uncharacterized protein YbjT (DUF2867 family)
MNTILGASGQVGSAIVSNLLRDRKPVKGIIRDKKKADDLKKKGAAVAIVDIHDERALTDSIKMLHLYLFLHQKVVKNKMC